jgi:anthranilate phosphoribosyltransferase
MTMNYSAHFKLLANNAQPPQDLDEATADMLYSALFDGGLPELESGAFVTYLHARPPSTQTLLGMQRALADRVTHLRLPRRDICPVLIPTYCGTVIYPNLTALLALLLRRYEIPVLLHGTLEGHGGVATAYVLREFNILPSGTAQHAQANLDKDLIAFVPTAVLSPGLAQLLAIRTRLGMSNQDYFQTALLDPFAGEALILSNVSETWDQTPLREVLQMKELNALLFPGTEGEPFVNPIRRPAIERIANGKNIILFETETDHTHYQSLTTRVPRNLNLSATSAWTKRALAGEVVIPHPVLNQLACCLFASGYTKDMHQAKAIAAMSSGTLVAA